MREVRSPAATIFTALTALLVWTADGAAAPQQLNCILTDTGAAGSAGQSIVVIFDEDAKTLQVEQSTQSYSLSNVSITNVSISGTSDNVSLGIDRSSLNIVWQQYGADKAVTQYGRCRQGATAAPADTH